MRSARAALAAALFFPALAWGQGTSGTSRITEEEFLAMTSPRPPRDPPA